MGSGQIAMVTPLGWDMGTSREGTGESCEVDSGSPCKGP